MTTQRSEPFELDRYRAEFAKRCPEAATSHIHLQECPTCGWLDWASSSKQDEHSFSVEQMDEIERCPRCMSVRVHHPELYMWVLSVMRYQNAK